MMLGLIETAERHNDAGVTAAKAIGVMNVEVHHCLQYRSPINS